MTSEEAEKILQAAVDKLGEHFDCVQILGSWTQGGHTLFLPRGSGNFYARIGMCHEFIESNKAQDQARQIIEKLSPPDSEF